MHVVGIVGKAGAGKSEVARRLVERHGFERGKFAGALKAMLRTFLSYRGADPTLIERMIEGDLKESPTALLNGQTPRHAMIELGHTWGRKSIDLNLWTDTEGEAVARREPAAIVFDDVRYPNEVETIRRLGGEIWEVRRHPGGRLIPRGLSLDERIAARQAEERAKAAFADHESESLVVTPDRLLVNDFTRAELHMLVDMQIGARRAIAARIAAGA